MIIDDCYLEKLLNLHYHKIQDTIIMFFYIEIDINNSTETVITNQYIALINVLLATNEKTCINTI